ncbi:MAG: hypothetical protein ABIG93_05225 [archaeon]
MKLYHGMSVHNALLLAEEGVVRSNWDLHCERLRKAFDENPALQDWLLKGKSIEDRALDFIMGKEQRYVHFTINLARAKIYSGHHEQPGKGGIIITLEKDQYPNIEKAEHQDDLYHIERNLQLTCIAEVHLTYVACQREEEIRSSFERYKPEVCYL